MKALLLAALLAAAPASEDTMTHRMNVGRVGAIVTFVAATAGLGLLLRKLGKDARAAEEHARLENAFREIEADLASRPQTTNPFSEHTSTRSRKDL